MDKTQRYPLPDNFGNEISYIEFGSAYEASHAAVRFTCEELTEKFFSEEVLAIFGFI